MNRRFIPAIIGLLSVTGVLLAIFAPIAVLALPVGLYVSDSSGSIFEFRPSGTQITFASGLDHPRGLTFDNAGNLLAATSLGSIQGTVLKFNSAGTQTTFGTVPGNNVLEGIVTKGANVFVIAQDQTTPAGASTVFRFSGGRGAATPFAPLPGQGLG